MQAYIIVRVSSSDQADNHSIPAQLSNLRQYAEKKSLKVVKEVELVESADKQRKQFNAVISEISASKEKIAIVVQAVDRLQRDYRATVLLDELRLKDKIEIHFNREGLILSQQSSGYEIFMWNMMVGIAKVENDNKRDRVKEVMVKMRSEGKFAHRAPFGYINIMGNIIPHPTLSAVVKDIFTQYSTSLHSLASLSDKIKSKHGVFIRVQKVFTILNNPFYYGVARSKKGDFVHNYERLIDKQLFDKCQQVRFGDRKEPKKQKYKSKSFIFRNLVKCGSCGRLINPDGPKRFGNVYYRCINKDCQHYLKTINEKIMIKDIEELIVAIQFPQEVQKIMVDYLRSKSDEENLYHQRLARELEQKYQNNLKRLDTLLNYFLDQNLDKDTYAGKKNKIEAEQLELASQLDKLTKYKSDTHDRVAELFELCRKIPEIWQGSNSDQKNRLLHFLISYPVQNGKEWRFEAKKPFTKKPPFGGFLDWLRIADTFRTQNWSDFSLINQVLELA